MVLSLALKDERSAQCARSCGNEFQMWGPKQEKVQKSQVLHLFNWIFSMWVSEESVQVEKKTNTSWYHIIHI